jgi:tRNA(Ile)-lysidine synthase|tara:strand:- start:9509 stop:10759 length:1251 start_codon:yes stop_codon:yes gene_type:complete
MTETDLIGAIEAQFLPHPPSKVGVAVSGGGDSMALLVLMASFAHTHDVELHAISVDHGLRDGAQAEIKLVTDLCSTLGVAHHVEYWSNWDGAGNLQGSARVARYELITAWAQSNDISNIALGHTANDQAETVLMRLARGAGVDGLAAMTPRRPANGINWIRPLLGENRETLRNYLRQKNLSWADDPSNENRDFERIRMRDALEVLAPLGITVQSLSDVAGNMGDARSALDWHTFLAAKEACVIAYGLVEIDLKIYRTLPVEIARRLLVRAIMWMNNSEYAPRRNAVFQAQKAIKKGTSATLDGCQVSCKKTHIYVFRELNAVREEVCEIGDHWDERWCLTGPEDDPELKVRPLGETGIRKSDTWRELGLPREAVLSLPAVWCGDELVAFPAGDQNMNWHAELIQGSDTFFATLLSH